MRSTPTNKRAISTRAEGERLLKPCAVKPRDPQVRAGRNGHSKPSAARPVRSLERPTGPVGRKPSKFQDQTREELLKLRSELIEELKQYESDFLTDTEIVPEGDDPTQRMLQQVRWGTMKHLNHRVREVNAALERLSDGGFGVCKDCGKRIGRPRLLANPTATRCLACQSQFERHHG
jgi:RNA polymerase-binding transcription factor DksA